MIRHRNNRIAALGILISSSITALTAHAETTINFGDDQSATFGLGLRTSYQSDNGTGQPNGQSINVDNLWLYSNFTFSKTVKATFDATANTQGNNNSLSVLDAYIQIEPTQSFNLWVGRLLPAADRADMEGPFYITSWNYPGVSSVYKEQYLFGRDQGATFWGIVGSDRLTYAIGAYQGMGKNAGNFNQYQGGGGSSDLMYTARLNYNFWDTKVDPAYFASQSYYGTHDVLALGLAGMTQKSGTLTTTGTAGYTAYNVDFIMEKKVNDGGAVTLSGAYYKVSTQNTLDNYVPLGAAIGGTWGGPAFQGISYIGTVAYLFPQKLGYGKVQPYVQHQDFTPDSFDTGAGAGQTFRTIQNEYGINYVINGANAKLTVAYSSTMFGKSSFNSFILGGQWQF